MEHLQSVYSKKTSNSHAEFQPGGSHFRCYICFRLALFTYSCVSIYVDIHVLSIFLKKKKTNKQNKTQKTPKTPRWKGIYTDISPLLYCNKSAIPLNHIKRDASHQILNSLKKFKKSLLLLWNESVWYASKRISSNYLSAFIHRYFHRTIAWNCYFTFFFFHKNYCITIGMFVSFHDLIPLCKQADMVTPLHCAKKKNKKTHNFLCLYG